MRLASSLALALAGLALAASAAQAQTDPKFTYATPEEKAAAAKAAAAAAEPEWKASAQAGLLLTTGNSRITTFSAGTTTTWKRGMNKVTLDGAAAYARSAIFLAVDEDASGTIEEDEISRPSQTTTRMWGARARYDRFLTEHNSLYAIAGMSSDRPAGRELVSNGQLGYSRQLYTDGTHLLVAEAGYDFTYEDLVAGEGTAIHSLRAFVGYGGKLSADTGVEASVEGLFNLNTLETGGRTIDAFEDDRVNSKLAITTKLFEDISFRFAFEARYDHAPAPRPPFALPYAPGFQPLSDELDTKTEAVLIVNFL